MSERGVPSPLRVYGRRKGKPLKPQRQSALARVLPRVRIDLPDAGRLDPLCLFPARCRQVWIEVGFGAGEHLAATATTHPDVGIIGCEVFINGVASLARHIDVAALDNVRVYDDDARRLLAALPDQSVGRFFLLFPDPWPKARHAKRRFIGPENLNEIARVLKDGAELRMASDDPGYIRWTLMHLTAHPDFVWTAAGPDDWRNPPPDSTPTRYQIKAVHAGRQPVFLRFSRAARG